VRPLARWSLALCLMLYATTAWAQETPTEEEPTEVPEAGPTLTPTNPTPPVCDPSRAAFRYVDVRGTNFDPWAGQRLPGTLVDQDGNTQASWKTIWVNPQGRLLLEVNLCEDAFLSRPPLAPGDYTLTVSDPTGQQPIAATTIEVQEPSEPSPTPVPATQTPVPTPMPLSTPVPTSATPNLSATPVTLTTPTPVVRTGPGSRQQPLPLGATGKLDDGWVIQVTGVTPDAWTAIQAYSSANPGPPTNLQFFMPRLRATYTGPSPVTPPFTALRLRLLGPSATYDPVTNSCGSIPDDISFNTVGPDGAVQGNVCFAVRSTDVPALLLYDSLQSESGRLYFALR
jgi:hypothetical protein